MCHSSVACFLGSVCDFLGFCCNVLWRTGMCYISLVIACVIQPCNTCPWYAWAFEMPSSSISDFYILSLDSYIAFTLDLLLVIAYTPLPTTLLYYHTHCIFRALYTLHSQGFGHTTHSVPWVCSWWWLSNALVIFMGWTVIACWSGLYRVLVQYVLYDGNNIAHESCSAFSISTSSFCSEMLESLGSIWDWTPKGQWPEACLCLCSCPLSQTQPKWHLVTQSYLELSRESLSLSFILLCIILA